MKVTYKLSTTFLKSGDWICFLKHQMLLVRQTQKLFNFCNQCEVFLHSLLTSLHRAVPKYHQLGAVLHNTQRSWTVSHAFNWALTKFDKGKRQRGIFSQKWKYSLILYFWHNHWTSDIQQNPQQTVKQNSLTFCKLTNTRTRIPHYGALTMWARRGQIK